MSTLQDHGLFPSRKRRSLQVDGLKEGVNRLFLSEITRETCDKPRKSQKSKPAAAELVADSFSGNTYVQEAIHKEVRYEREGSEGVPENTLKVFRFVQKNYIVPQDFEKNHKFGPLSGVSHELRVVSAFMAGRLEKRSKGVLVKMCLECGKLGHFPRHCPSLLLE